VPTSIDVRRLRPHGWRVYGAHRGRAETKSRELLDKHEKLAERLRLDEIKTVQLEGDLKLLAQRHENLDSDIREIKANQVPRIEWENRMSALDKSMKQCIDAVMSLRPGRYQSPSSSDKIPSNR
jgi:hypothetical protein